MCEAFGRFTGFLDEEHWAAAMKTVRVCSEHESLKSELLAAGFADVQVHESRSRFESDFPAMDMLTAVRTNPILSQCLKNATISTDEEWKDIWLRFLDSATAFVASKEGGSEGEKIIYLNNVALVAVAIA